MNSAGQNSPKQKLKVAAKIDLSQGKHSLCPNEEEIAQDCSKQDISQQMLGRNTNRSQDSKEAEDSMESSRENIIPENTQREAHSNEKDLDQQQELYVPDLNSSYQNQVSLEMPYKKYHMKNKN